MSSLDFIQQDYSIYTYRKPKFLIRFACDFFIIVEHKSMIYGGVTYLLFSFYCLCKMRKVK